MSRCHGRGIAASSLIVIAALVLAGCSSSSAASGEATTGASAAVSGSEGSTDATTGATAEESGSDVAGEATTGENTAVSNAEELFAQYTQAQPDITVEALAAKPPADKKIAILSCPTPGCQVSMKATQEGAEKLGWTAEYFTSQLTPEDYQATWDRMLQASPDLIAYQAFFPNAVIKTQLDKAAEANIKVVSMVSTDPVDDIMRGVALGPVDTGFSGELLAASVVADAKGAAKTAYVTDPSFKLWDNLQNKYVEGVENAGGSVDVVEVSLQNGTAIPGQVTSFLQSNPDVQYVVFPDASSVMLGVPTALKAAGISGVKIASVAPQASDLSELKSGVQWISVATEVAASGYRLTDMLAHLVDGSSFDPTPIGWHQIMTQDNITDTSQVPPTPGSPQSFFTAWHVG